MKIQGLAIIFIIIILPITLIIGEYASMQIDTFRIEQLYDSRLITATHDALKAFQINTFNDVTSDIADSKITSIEASANAFYNSMESSFGLEGYSKEDLQLYIPAIVYTMYDGYYIYSPYTNVAEIVEKTAGDSGQDLDEDYIEKELNINLDSNDIDYGFKPYVYYSCRYVKGNIDVIINYALDNYITVQGTINGEAIYKSGYLLTIDTAEGLRKTKQNGIATYIYNGSVISPEASLTDNLVEVDANGNVTKKTYKYIKLNGTKYYWNEDEEYIFYLMGGERNKQVTKATNEELYNKYVEQIKSNTSAISYYRSAYEFTDWVNNNLGTLTPLDAQIDDNTSYVKNSGTGAIFKNINIEYSNSNFNAHRKEVIRYAIESNLSVAIANFNSYTSSGTSFQMPKLKETEWEMLENEVSIISFLQGLNIGGKIYNGYTVVSNDKTEEVVKEERIYITTSDGYYHKINDKHFQTGSSNAYESSNTVLGVLDLDFEIRKDGATGISYTQKNDLGCYTSIVGQENVDNKYDSIYEYLAETEIDNKIENLYYTALGRERWGTYKIENPSNLGNLLDEMLPMNNYDIVTDGLIRFYHAKNVDGNGNAGNDGTTVWKDLSGHYDAILNGATANQNGYVSFDGINDWANCGIVDLDYATINLQMELKSIGGTDTYYLFNNWETNMSGLGFLIRPDGQLHFTFYDESGAEHLVTSGVTMQKNKVYDITGTFDGSQIKLYINGVLKATSTATGKINGPKENTVLGIAVNTIGSNPDSWSKYANMNVHSVKVYERALTQEEIQQNYNAMHVATSTPSSEDHTAPVIIIGNEDGVITDTYDMLFNDTMVTIAKRIEATDNVGVETLKCIYSTDVTIPVDTEAWQNAFENTVATLNITSGGYYYLHVKAIDVSGNEATKTIKYSVSQVEKDNLLASFDFNNMNNSTTINDQTGNHEGIINGGAVNSEYVELDGTDDWINLGQFRDKTEITLEAKIKINSIQAGEHIVMCNYDTGGVGIHLYDGKPEFQVYVQGVGYVKASYNQVLETNKIYNLSGTYDGTTLKVFVDGELKAEKVVVGNIKNPENNTVMAIGANPSGSNPVDCGFANIKVYSARIYDRALTINEIKQNIIATE